MIDHILKSVLEDNRSELEKYKKHAGAKVLETAKKYWRYLAIAGVLVLVAIIGIVWMLWSALSGAASWISINGTEVVKKVEEVGINGLIEEPLQMARDIWYGKDGK